MPNLMKFYYDLLSQPCRALYMFLEVNQIPYAPVMLSLRKGEHLKEEFKDINRFKKLPCIEENGVKLSESVAIFRYLMENKLVPDHWYPKDTKKRARVDEYLSWQHTNIRYGSTMLFKSKFVEPVRTGKQSNPDLTREYERILKSSLDTIETIWLNHSENYLFGKQITIADLMAATEIEQPRLAGFDPLAGRPRTAEYIGMVKKTMTPYYEDAHSFIDELASELKKLEEVKLRKVN